MPPPPPPSTAPDDARAERQAARSAARQLPRTRLGIAIGLIAIAAAATAAVTTDLSVRLIVETYGVFPMRASGAAGQVSPLLLSYVIGAGLALGGLLMLLPRTAGWWLTLIAAALGPLDLIRIYRRLVQAINYDNPDVDQVITNLILFTGLPALFYVGLLILLLQRRVRATYRI